MKTMSKYKVDTKGSCLLCFTKNETNQDSSKICWSLIELSRFLKFDYATVFNLSDKMEEEGGLEEMEMIVPLCVNCSTFVQQFSQLYKELEMIKLKLNGCVRTIHDVMTDADKDTERVQGYREEVRRTRNPLGLMNATIAENLRKEIIHKCSARLKTAFPVVNVTNDVTTKQEVLDDEQPPSNNSFEDNTGVEDQLDVVEPECEVQETYQLFEDNVEELMGEEDPIETNVIPSNSSRVTKRLKLRQPTKFQTKTKYKCNICSKTFTNGLSLKNHSVEYHLETYFVSLLDPAMPPKHFEEVVERLVKPFERRSGKGDKSFGCSFCPKHFGRRVILRHHNITRHLDKLHGMLQNELKGRGGSAIAGSSKSAIKKRKTPSGNLGGTPTCLTCGKTFSSKQKLERHGRLHTGEKPHKCPYCPLSFTFDTQQTNHIVRVHLADVFMDFKRDSVTADDFEKIVTTMVESCVGIVPNDKSFYCSLCSKACSTNSNCKYHLISKHFHELAEKM